MTVITAFLIFAVMFFAQIAFVLQLQIVPSKLCCRIIIRIGRIKLVDETLSLCGAKINCTGSIATTVNLADTKPKSGLQLIKCLTLRRLCIGVANNAYSCNCVVLVVQKWLAMISALVVCNVSNCDYCTSVTLVDVPTNICCLATVKISLAQLSLFIIKQGVEKWKTRK